MAEHYQRGIAHTLPQSKSSGSCHDDLQEQFDGSSYIFDDLGDSGSETMCPLQNYDLFSSSCPLLFSETAPEGLAPVANRNGELRPPPDVPSSCSSTLIASMVSNTYDSRDYDPNELSLLAPSTVMLGRDERINENAPNFWDSLGHSTVHLPPASSNNSALIVTSHHQLMGDSNSTTITQKRKRHVAGLPKNLNSNDLIDKRYALKSFVKHLPDPTFNTIESLANDFGFPFEYVMDLWCQHRKNRKSGSFYLNDCASMNHPNPIIKESEKFRVPSREGSVAISEPSEVPTKRPRSNTETSQAADGDHRNKLHQCPQCGGGVTRQANLPRHLRTHFPGQFHCQYPGCNKVFSRKDKLNDHFKRMHGNGNSKLDIVQRRKDDPENDPDSEGPGDVDKLGHRGGYSRSGKPKQGSQDGAIPTSSRESAQDTYSNDIAKSLSAGCEFFAPVSQHTSAVEYLRKFVASHINGKLGQGGFGQVYEISVNNGADAKDPEAFACKSIRLPNHSRDEVVERARNEINILRVLNHPHIIEFAGAIIFPNSAFIYTRPVAECNLKEFLSRQLSPLLTLLKCQIWEGIRGIALAIAYLHGHERGGGFHGDIKPENILVMEDEKVESGVKFLLADFGSARLSSSTSRVIHSNQALTPRYCAPEWFENGERGPPSDIWSFGCVMAYIVTYLHDKTAADFETFRVYSEEVKTDWNYHESLPVVKDWLRFLFHNCSKVTYTPVVLEHMDLIFHMLSSSPRERPSSKDVVTKLEVYKSVTAQIADQARNAIMELLEQPQEILQQTHTNDYRSTNCGFERPDTEDLGIWQHESTDFHYVSGRSGEGKSTLMQYTDNDSREDLRWKLVLSGKDTLRMHGPVQDVGNSINAFMNYFSETQHAGEAPHNRIITQSTQAESFISSNGGPVMMPVDDQAPLNNLVCLQPRTPYFQLKVTPKCRQPLVKDLEDYSFFRKILPKSNSSCRKSAQRHCRRPGGRRGRAEPLPIKFITSTKACWNCQIKKESWNSGPTSTPCDRCWDKIPSPFKTTIRYRASLGDYFACFFPELLYSHLREFAIEKILRTNLIGFTQNIIKVELSSGPDYPPIQLIVHEFVPSNREFLSFSYVEQISSDGCHKFAPSYAPPLGVYDIGRINLRNICLSHIKSIIKHSRSLGEYTRGDTSIIIWKVFEAVNRYRKLSSGTGGNRTLLRKAVMLYTMHYFMSRIVTFTKESVKEVITSLRAPRMLPYTTEPTLTSTLLNLQIKQTMLSLLKHIMRDVLSGLEQLLTHRRTKSSWVDSFCVSLTLFMCIELVQVQVDSFAIAACRKDPEFVKFRLIISRALDEEPSRQLEELFHAAYKTFGSDLKKKGSSGFNPIRNGLRVDQNDGITQQMTDLVQDIRQIIEQHGKEIEEISEPPSFDAGKDLLTQHMVFRKRNSGRLVSKFLKSFT